MAPSLMNGNGLGQKVMSDLPNGSVKNSLDQAKALVEKTEEGDTEFKALLEGLSMEPKQIPCSYLYDEAGSALYNQITELEEYYPYKTEIKLLTEHAQDIIKTIPKGSKIVELGCGSASKTSILQKELLKRDGPKNCSFIGIDVSADFLEQARENMLEACPGLLSSNVEMIEASYLEGLQEARKRHKNDVLCILWLGSSIGNLDHKESQNFFKEVLRISGPQTQILVCTDLWKDDFILYRAYHDSLGVTEAFIKNGLKNAAQAASKGKVHVNFDKWQYEVIVNPETHQVEMYLRACENANLTPAIGINCGERILMEVSRKFLPETMRTLAFTTGFYHQAQWRNNLYSIQMLSSPALAFQLTWQKSDQLFAHVHDWNSIPISLRHPFCFYYGHIAAFSKIKLLEDRQRAKWDEMFSRGIDPDVCDPSQCHHHPEAPEVWPGKAEIVTYVNEARRVIMDYAQGETQKLWLINMVLEHECMHQETLCYMLAQSQKKMWEDTHLTDEGDLKVQNGIGFEEPLARWTNLSEDSDYKITQSWSKVPAGKVTLGVEIKPRQDFNWDNEGPPQGAQDVESFKVANKPVTVEEYRDFVMRGGYTNSELWTREHMQCLASKQNAPATWTITGNKDIWIHYPEGTWHWTAVRNRPVWCSLAEAQAFCMEKGMRVMSELEYLRALQYNSTENRIEELDCNGWELTCSKMEALKGFMPMNNYPEYSSDFYDGKHFVLRGSSPYTPISMIRPSFRNFYQDVYSYQFAKFRCCSTNTQD